MTSTSARAAAAALALLLLARVAAAEAPAVWVRRIELRGVRQLGKSTLRDRIDLKTWRALPADPAVTVPPQVAEAYTRSGLPAPKVTVTVGEPDAKGAVTVTLDVAETPLPKLESLRFDLDGLPFFSSLSTEGKVLYFRLDAKLFRFNRKDLDSGLKKEQRRLRGLGWKGATFEVVEEPKEDGAARAVAVTLDLGPRESLQGKGIDRPVMKEVTASWKRRNVPLSEGVVSRLARSAATGMTERGYVDVTVTPSERQEGKRRTVVLTATHGPRLAVEAIRFEGAGSISRKELLKALPLHEPQLFGLSKSHPGPESLEESRLALVELYSRSGFPEATVEAAVDGEGDRRTVVFRVKEGPRRTIGSLTFPGASVIPAAELGRISKLAEGKPWVPSRATEAAGEIRKAYSRRGYDEATVTPRPGAPDGEGRVPLAFEIHEGTAYRLGAIEVRGNTKTTTRKILSIGDERPGKPLDSVQLAEHQSHLSRLGVFDTVSVTSAPVPGSSPPEKSVLVEVVERPTRYVEYGFDLNTQRGLEVAGTLGERNLFGNATNGAFSALVGKKRQSFVLEVGQPALFGTRLIGSLKGVYTWDTTYDGFSLQTMGVQAGLSWEFDPKHLVTLVARIEEQLPLDVEPDVEEELLPETERIGSLTPSVSLDQRDDPFLPTTGTYFLVRDKISRPYFGGDADFDRVEGDGRYFRSFGSAIVAAGALRVGYARAHGGTALPVGERFYVGGASTHRGFRENELGPKGDDGSSLGGESYVLANVELRAPVLGPVEGGLFLDVGNAWLGRIDVTDLRWAAGAGLRMRTPVGPLRFDMGYLIDRREGESRTVFHLALGYPF